MGEEKKASDASGSQQQQQQKQAPQLAELKTGEYMVHVYVQETRALKSPKGEDETVDPILKVQALGQTRYSKVKKKVGTGAVHWGEHIFFESSFDNTHEVEAQKIVINVNDHRTLGKDALIGSIELNLTTIYYQDKHTMFHRWAALANFGKNYQDVMGFVKFSITVTAAGDEQITLEDEKNTSFDAKNVMFPPQIQTKPYQLHIFVIRGERLKKMDTMGKVDPFVRVEMAGIKQQTEVIKSDYNPKWNQEILLPISMPTVNEYITLKLFDWDLGSPDEIMGSCSFKIQDILDGKHKKFFWVNIYGAATGAKDSMAKMMNEFPDLGNEWKGRIQIALLMEQNKKPTSKVQKVSDKRILDLAYADEVFRYELRCDFFWIKNLPEEKEYYLKIRWTNSEATTAKKKAKNRMVEIYESKGMQEAFPIPNLEYIGGPDVFIYLMQGDQIISYMRRPVTDFLDPASPPELVFLKVDKSVSKARDDLGGLLKLRLYCSSLSNRPPLHLNKWDKPVEHKIPTKQWRIFVNLYQAQGLTAADDNGVSDPFVKVYFMGTEKQTTIVKETVNPIWNERIEFDALFDDPEDCPPFIITVWDWDEGSKAEFLGYAVCLLEDKFCNTTEPVLPTWIPVQYGSSNQGYGKVLMSFNAYSDYNLIPRDLSIEPVTRKYFMNMKILGLRNLKSMGVLPVKRAFIRFDIDSCRSKSDKSLLREKRFIRTEPLDSGPNPNILSVINLELNLPEKLEYCPAMSCAVFDFIFRGMGQPLLGNFSIPLAKYIKKSRDKMDKELKELNQLALKAAREEALKKMESQSSKSSIASSVSEDDDDDDEIDYSSSTRAKKSFIKMLTRESKIIEADEDNPSEYEQGKKKAEDDKLDPEQFIIKPTFKQEKGQLPKETNTPTNPQYMALGYNKGDKKNKHYRYCLQEGLEETRYLDESPFDEIAIYRGKKLEDNSFSFSKLFKKKGESDYQLVGYFKAMIELISEDDKLRYETKYSAITRKLPEKPIEFKDQEFLQRNTCVCRLYIIEAGDLVDKDEDSNSDPYLRIRIGKLDINEKKNWQDDEPNPKFHRFYEFPLVLPGASLMTVQIYDHDDFARDDLIGETKIDLEDRYFSKKWRALGSNIPIETRKIYHPSSRIPQGWVRLWTEVLPKDEAGGKDSKYPKYDITPKPEEEFELRVVVWECKEIPLVDAEGCVDIYWTFKIGDTTLKTDTHIRSQNGKGSFNWRLVFPLKLPLKQHQITIQVWDKDLLSKDDFIAESTFDFTPEATLAFENDIAVKILGGKKKKDEKFWIQTHKSGKNGGLEACGKVEVSMELIPKKEAKLTPVGQGRSSPNQMPFLPPPLGRVKFNIFNPLATFNQLLGGVARRKIYMVCCCACCIALCALVFPMFISTELTQIIHDII